MGGWNIFPYYSVLLSKSTDGGATFNDPVKVYHGDLDPSKTAVSGSDVYVLSEDDTNVFLIKSTDGGATFNDPVNLSNISVSGSKVYVVSVDSTDTISDIILKRIAS
jgi:hypothetical protein